MKYKYLTAALLFVSVLFAQETKVFSPAEYDSLKNRKARLLEEKTDLIQFIRKGEKELDSLKQAVKDAKHDLYIKRYGNENGTRVANGQVWKGMTDKMLGDSWGKPDKIDKNVEKWGVFTQWYYGTITYFFKNGKLTDWEDSAKK